MRAFLKGKLTISKTRWDQDSTGGKKEVKIPIANDVRFIGRESTLGIINMPGKDAVEKGYKLWFETKEDLLNYDLEEYGYVNIGDNCYKIISVQLVNSYTGKYGWELGVRARN